MKSDFSEGNTSQPRAQLLRKHEREKLVLLALLMLCYSCEHNSRARDLKRTYSNLVHAAPYVSTFFFCVPNALF